MAEDGAVFITGASGFIGRALAERLRRDGREVRGVDIAAAPEEGVVAGNTCAPEGWENHLRGCGLVLHTAAVVSFGGSTARAWRINVLGTRRVLEAAARAGVRRFLHLSSVTAFGFHFPDGVDERWPVRCNGNPYVDTKVAGEQVVLQAHAAGEIECTIVRPGDAYGPRSRPWTVLPVQAIKEHRMVLPARGRGVFSPVFIDNLVDGILSAAASPAASGQVFIVSDGEGVATADFFGRYCEMLGARPPRCVPTPAARALAHLSPTVDRLRRTNSEVNPAVVDYLCRTGTYSIAKARAVLGYRPARDLDEGMALTREWLAREGLLD